MRERVVGHAGAGLTPHGLAEDSRRDFWSGEIGLLVADSGLAVWSSQCQFMGEGMSNWYQNEFQVLYETWPQTRSISYQVLQSSSLENSEILT